MLVGIVFLLGIKISFADSSYVCEWTSDNNFCVQESDNTFSDHGGCKSGYLDSFTTLNNVANCQVGTCVPAASCKA